MSRPEIYLPFYSFMTGKRPLRWWHLKRFLVLFLPYWRWWCANGFPADACRTVFEDETGDRVTEIGCHAPGGARGRALSTPRYIYSSRVWSTLRACWYEARYGRVHSLALPVLNAPRSPCAGCGAKCCQKAQHQPGFDVVVVYPWELFAQQHPEVLEPSTQTAGELVFRFHYEKGAARCPFLNAQDRCSVYVERPISCRNPECVDALDPQWKRYSCMTQLVEARPDIRAYLRQALAEGRMTMPGLPEPVRPTPVAVRDDAQKEVCCAG